MSCSYKSHRNPDNIYLTSSQTICIVPNESRLNCVLKKWFIVVWSLVPYLVPAFECVHLGTVAIVHQYQYLGVPGSFEKNMYTLLLHISQINMAHRSPPPTRPCTTLGHSYYSHGCKNISYRLLHWDSTFRYLNLLVSYRYFKEFSFHVPTFVYIAI